MTKDEKGYEDIPDLISMCEYEIERKGYDSEFVTSIKKQYMDNHRLSEKQVRALENIARDRINKTLEMNHNGRLF